MNKKLLLLFIIAIFAIQLTAKVEWAAYPAGGYSDETDLSFGLLAYLRFTPEIQDSSKKVNSVYFLSKYTLKDQFIFALNPELYYQNGKYRLNSNLEFRSWPTTFYGIGNNTDLDDSEEYTPESYFIDFELSRKLISNLSISIQTDFSSFQIKKIETDSALEIYKKYSQASAIGLGLCWDSRNGQFYPTKGFYGKYNVNFFDDLFSSDYSFIQHSFDIRQFLKVSSKSVLSWQFIGAFSSGNVPFFKKYRLDNNMRGIPANLHIDENFSVLRSEYKIFPWRGYFSQKIGFATFLEFGSVFDKLENYQIKDNKINYGAGFRYTIIPGDKLNFRIDVGFGENGQQLTIMASEEF